MQIFITGGSRGIGRDIVISAAEQGHDIAFTYVNDKSSADAVLDKVASIAPTVKCLAYQLDVKSSRAVETVVNQVSDDFGCVQAVISNAGVNRNNLIFNMSDEEWQEVIDINLTGAFYIARQFLPIFISERTGKFIFISSVAKDGLVGQANYSASKSGLSGLSGALAKEYGSRGITSNVISPGIFETDMTKNHLSEQHRKYWLETCPLKRMGKLSELSGLVLFLISEAANFVNGQVISVTGGLDWVI